MKRIGTLITFIVLAALVAGCDKNKRDGGMGPSRNDTPATPTSSQLDLRDKVYVEIMRTKPNNQIHVQVCGNLNLALHVPQDWARNWNFRVREYSFGTRKTWLAGMNNAAPYGNTDCTLIRDIDTNGTVDVSLNIDNGQIVDPFVFRNRDVLIMVPKTMNIGREDPNTHEVRITGTLPPLT